jgi:hypothetical protein
MTQEYWDSGLAQGTSRVLDAWDSERVRLTGTTLRQGLAIVLGRFSLAYHATPVDAEEARLEEDDLREVDWITDLPGLDQAWQMTVFITDAGTKSTPPGTRRMGSVPVGKLDLSNGGEVWVMRHLISVSAEMKDNITNGLTLALSKIEGGPTEGVHRALLRGREEGGLRWWLEAAATAGLPGNIPDF